MRWLALFLALLAILAAGPPSRLRAQSPDSSIAWVQGGPYRLKVALFPSGTVTSAQTLVVVLHGDAPFNKPDYQDRFAARAAARFPGLIAAAILRPGYTDPAGHTSDGERGATTGDNYNATNTDAIAAAIATLQARFHSVRVILVGHSGGAAIAANILGRHPALASAALLVSCPCDVVQWRAHMFQKTQFAGFQGAIQTVSPIDLVDQISSEAQVAMIVGAQDDVAPPDLSQAYYTKARAAGKRVQLTLVPGEGHEILLEPIVLDAMASLVR